jgi:hypothetical protein
MDTTDLREEATAICLEMPGPVAEHLAELLNWAADEIDRLRPDAGRPRERPLREAGWFCERCEQTVSSKNVTYEGHHAGGCGGRCE